MPYPEKKGPKVHSSRYGVHYVEVGELLSSEAGQEQLAKMAEIEISASGQGGRSPEPPSEQAVKELSEPEPAGI